ncbi:MAG: phosphohistidine phosphatase SixA [Chloroflexi bacterium]|nr:phosphohistidine phosphatase SixA [Chloroflexota bacterium]
MNLYLIRHAIAVEEFEDDSQRPLTEKGRKKMRQIAKGLRALGVEFDLILSSPYVRAVETAEILADVFKMKREVQISGNLTPMGDPDLLISEINEKYKAGSLALVGHEPFLTALIGLLIADNANVDITLKKGGVCSLSADDLHHTRKASMDWLLTPGVLVGISEK